MEDTIAKENTNAPVREEDGPRINEEIRVKEVRLITEKIAELFRFEKPYSALLTLIWT